ncbi:MAG: hypothetical protein Q9207_006355 [Kuettlingeria erythrocarpa]
MWKNKLLKLDLSAWKEGGEEKAQLIHFANQLEGPERFPDIAQEELQYGAAKEKEEKTFKCKALDYVKMKMKKEVPEQEKGFYVERRRSTQHSSSLGAGGDSVQERQASASSNPSRRPVPNSMWKKTTTTTERDSAPVQSVPRPIMVPVVVKFEIFKYGVSYGYAMAAYSIPTSITFRAFLQDAVLQLRRQSSSPMDFPRELLLNEFVEADWHHKHQYPVDPRFANELDPGNWEASMKLYAAHLQPIPLEIKLMISEMPLIPTDSGQGESGEDDFGEGGSGEAKSGSNNSDPGSPSMSGAWQTSNSPEDPDAITPASPLKARYACDAFGNEY